MLEDEPWQRLLHHALAFLASRPEEQIRVTGQGCVACELLNDIDHARTVAIGNAADLSDKQRILLDQIDATMRTMEKADFECFNNEVIRRPVWQLLREQATQALRAFGWVWAE
jgi:hypothetical protein